MEVRFPRLRWLQGSSLAYTVFHGLRYCDLNEVERRVFSHIVFPCKQLKGLTYAQKVEAYERLAYGGTPHEPKRIATEGV